MKFSDFYQSRDVFGFEKKTAEDDDPEKASERPVRPFNVELMMDLLSKKTINSHRAYQPFMNEIRWGNQPGSVLLDVDTGYTFHIRKLATDRQGNPRWVTKRLYQLNRHGYGGQEDIVAQEIYDHLVKCADSIIESPNTDVQMEDLVDFLYRRAKAQASEIFYPEGVRKVSDDHYILKFAVKGGGHEAPDHTRVEQNQTAISYDRQSGTIRVTNYNIESPVARGHSWDIGVSDLDLYFLPSQDKDEIAKCLQVHLKYY